MESWKSGRSELPELQICEGIPLLTEAIMKAYDDQSEIGWYHAPIGRLAKSWRHCMRKCLQDDEHTDGKIEGCARDMVQNMWSMMLSLWRKRNDLEHGCDAFYSKADIQTMIEIVIACYDKFSSDVDNNENGFSK